ncbi:MAG: hypothetical protein ACPKPY_10310 [Nitrososphaeraceae archaeon]
MFDNKFIIFGTLLFTIFLLIPSTLDISALEKSIDQYDNEYFYENNIYKIIDIHHDTHLMEISMEFYVCDKRLISNIEEDFECLSLL